VDVGVSGLMGFTVGLVGLISLLIMLVLRAVNQCMSWMKVVNVNLKGCFLTSKYAIPHMLKNGGGVIINV